MKKLKCSTGLKKLFALSLILTCTAILCACNDDGNHGSMVESSSSAPGESSSAPGESSSEGHTSGLVGDVVDQITEDVSEGIRDIAD